MDAILLAAGFGTRLRPHTLTTPKPLLPIQGRPILDWSMGALPSAVDRVIVVAHYMADQIEAFIRKQTWFTNFEIVIQETPKGTGDALRICQKSIRSSSFLVLNGDDLYGSRDLETLARAKAGVLTREVQDPWNFGVAHLKADNTSLDKMVEKPKIQGPALANTGAYHFPKSIFDMELTVSSRGEYEITDYLSNLAIHQKVEVIPCGFWFPVGTVEAWENAQKADFTPLVR